MAEDRGDDEVLDGNASAGPLGAVFGGDMTVVPGKCAHCGTVHAIAELRAYMRAPGWCCAARSVGRSSSRSSRPTRRPTSMPAVPRTCTSTGDVRPRTPVLTLTGSKVYGQPMAAIPAGFLVIADLTGPAITLS